MAIDKADILTFLKDEPVSEKKEDEKKIGLKKRISRISSKY